MNTNIINRKNEILSVMKSFTKEEYTREELLPELYSLRDEAVRLTFDRLYNNNQKIYLKRISEHMKQVSIEKVGYVIDEIAKFEKYSFDLTNCIKRIQSGNTGENIVSEKLMDLSCYNKILRNVELTSTDARSELDAVVITSKALVIVEVKNTSRNVFIDNSGVYYTVGSYMHKDSDLKFKMNRRETLLRSILENAGFKDIRIESIVVFTNNDIKVHNVCESLNTAFLEMLPAYIDSIKGDDIYTKEMIKFLYKYIDKSRCLESYKAEAVVHEFKESFALATAALEELESHKTTIFFTSFKRRIAAIFGKAAPASFAGELKHTISKGLPASDVSKLAVENAFARR